MLGTCLVLTFYEQCRLYFYRERETAEGGHENHGHRRLDAVLKLVYSIVLHANDNNGDYHGVVDGTTFTQCVLVSNETDCFFNHYFILLGGSVR